MLCMRVPKGSRGTGSRPLQCSGLGHESREQAIHLSINGIAAGLKNTV